MPPGVIEILGVTLILGALAVLIYLGIALAARALKWADRRDAAEAKAASDAAERWRERT